MAGLEVTLASGTRTAQSIWEFDELMTRMMSDNLIARRFTTNVVMTSIMRSLFVPSQ